MTGVGLRIGDPGSVLRRVALGLGLAAAVALQIAGGAGAVGLPGVGGPRQADPCAAERAPILERQKQYEAVRRSHLGQALGAGLKKGALFFGAQMLNHYASGLTGGLAPSGVGLLSPSSLQEAGNLQIPGVTTAAGSGAFAGANLGASDTRSIAALAVVVAVVGTVEAYVQLKEQEAAGDPLKLAGSIDQDAGRQVAVNQAIAAEETALAACRAREVADYQSRLGGASNADDRRAVARDKTALQGAIKKDVDLTGGVVDQQAGLAKTYTQGRAMAEGTSEADVLAGQKPAYADAASTAPLKPPPPPQGAAPIAPLPPPPPPPPPPKPSPPVWTTAHALTVRSAASAKSSAVASLAAGVEVDVRETVKAPQGWSAVKVAGRTGYVRTANLVKTIPPQPPAVAAAPALAPPSNIREHNRAVIAARQEGPDRLKTLLTDVEAQRRHGRPALA